MDIRYLFVLISLSLVPGVAQAQNDLLSDHALEWTFYGEHEEGYIDHDHGYFIDDYTLGNQYEKNGKTYRSLYFYRDFPDDAGVRRSKESQSFGWGVGGAGSIGIRVDGDRVLADREEYLALMADNSYWHLVGDRDYIPYEQTEDGELVLYDFSKKAGDKFAHVEGHDDITVLAVDFVTTRDGVRRCRQILSNGAAVIGGIGCVCSTGMWLFYLNPAESPCTKGMLTELYKDGKFLFGNGDQLSDVYVPGMWTYNGRSSDGQYYTETFGFGGAYYKGVKSYCIVSFHQGQEHGELEVRVEGDRMLVDREEYLALLADGSFWSREGDRDYIPYEETEDGELVLYDFSKKVGDKFVSVPGHCDITVEGVERIITRDGIVRRVQRLSNGCTVIENIGCIDSPGAWLFYLNPADSELVTLGSCYTTLHRLIFKWGDQEQTVSITAAGNTAAGNTDAIWNLQGQRLANVPQKGVFIRNGKKHILQ